MTESAYRPQTLDPGPPPPRNTGVAETSIAGGLPKSSERYSWTPSKQSTASQSEKKAPVGRLEKEAQQPRPVVKDLAAPATSPSTRPRSRLRARKAAMTLTPGAVDRLRELLDDPEPKLIRVGVKNKGCSGSAYHLEYVEKPGKFDEQVEQDGVKVLIDSKALIKVIGSEMDWVEDKLSSRFTFTNPNISKHSTSRILLISLLTNGQLNNVVVASHLALYKAFILALARHGQALERRR
jgi:iron-sulfur cluster assembly accessory protein